MKDKLQKVISGILNSCNPLRNGVISGTFTDEKVMIQMS